MTKQLIVKAGMSKVRPGGQLRPVFKFPPARSLCYKISNMRPASTVVDYSIIRIQKLFYISPEGGSAEVWPHSSCVTLA